MKNITLLIVFVLSIFYTADAQVAESKTIVSDEFHFIAFFPDRPTMSQGDVSTRFGQGYSRRWTLESPDVFYEVSVDDYPDLSVEVDYKSLNLFYDTVYSDFAGQYGGKCCGSGSTKVLFTEFGIEAGSRTKDVFFNVQMYLIRQRLYQLKVVMRTSLEKDKQTREDVGKFMGEFVFVYRKENEKEYSYGLPVSVSQNLERRKN